MGSSHLLKAAGQALRSNRSFPAVLLRIEFTAAFCLQTPGELLPRLSTLTCLRQAVYLCCTGPEVAFGGRYPLSMPCGARTFLVRGLSAHLPRLPGLLTRTFYDNHNRLSIFHLVFIVILTNAQYRSRSAGIYSALRENVAWPASSLYYSSIPTPGCAPAVLREQLHAAPE